MRTRFAPSPTGDLHLGNARTALLNWLVARHHGGRFLLRFEDTDVERNVEESEGRVLESLDWLGLGRDEGPEAGGDRGPYRQSERLHLYGDHAERLLQRGLAYHCYCLPEELKARREAAMERGERPTYDGRCRELDPEQEAEFRAEGRSPSVRMKVDPGPVAFEDRVRGEVTIRGREFGDFVLLRSDGRPTYNFAVVVDDLLMDVTHVIRGAGHLSNTPKQLLVYRALGEEPPAFVHVPLVLAPDGQPLSKRRGARGVLEYRDRGYHPDAVVNYLSLLSWSSGKGEEYLTREQLVEEMDLDRLGRSDAALDREKMRWLSGLHWRREPTDRLASALADYLPTEEWGVSGDRLRALAELLADRIQTLADAREQAAPLFSEPDLDDPDVRQVLAGDTAAGVLAQARREWESVEPWEPGPIQEALERAAAAAGAGGRGLYQPLRAALTGELRGPSLPAVVRILGRDRVLGRLATALERAEGGG